MNKREESVLDVKIGKLSEEVTSQTSWLTRALSVKGKSEMISTIQEGAFQKSPNYTDSIDSRAKKRTWFKLHLRLTK